MISRLLQDHSSGELGYAANVRYGPWDNDDLCDLLVADVGMMVGESKDLAVDIVAAQEAVEPGVIVVIPRRPYHHLVQRLAGLLVVLRGRVGLGIRTSQCEQY